MSRANVTLYRAILRAAHKFEDANFKAYFLRRAREDWRSGRGEDSGFVAEQKENLRVLERQGVISSLFPSPSYSAENKHGPS